MLCALPFRHRGLHVVQDARELIWWWRNRQDVLEEIRLG